MALRIQLHDFRGIRAGVHEADQAVAAFREVVHIAGGDGEELFVVVELPDELNGAVALVYPVLYGAAVEFFRRIGFS